MKNRIPMNCKFSLLKVTLFNIVWSLVVWCLTTFGSLTAKAEDLTVSQAVEISLSNQPQVQAAREKLNEVEADRHLAFAMLYPNISGVASYLYRQDGILPPDLPLFNGDPYNNYSVGLSLVQPIYHAGALTAGIRALNKERKARQLDVDIAERTVTSATLKAFFDLILAERKLESIQRVESIQKELLATSQSRYRVGNEQLLNVMENKTALLLIVPQVSQAQSDFRVSAVALANQLADPKRKEIKIVGSLTAPSWGELKNKVPEDRGADTPEIVQAMVNEDEFEDTRTVTLSQNWPHLDLVGTWGRNVFRKTDLFNSDATSWTVGLQLSVPIFSGLSFFAQRKQLTSQAEQLKITEHQLRLNLSLNRVTSEENLEHRRSAVDDSFKALSNATEASKLAARTYRLGTSTYTQASDAQVQLANAETAFDQAEYDYITELSDYFVQHNWPLPILVQSLEASFSKGLKKAETKAETKKDEG